MTTENTKITGADLIAQGWAPGPAIGMALRVAQGLPNPKEEILQTLAQVYEMPADYLDHKHWGEAAGALILKMRKEAGPEPIELRRLGLEESFLSSPSLTSDRERTLFSSSKTSSVSDATSE